MAQSTVYKASGSKTSGPAESRREASGQEARTRNVATQAATEPDYGPLWRRLFAGALAYVVYFLAGYLLAEAGCLIPVLRDKIGPLSLLAVIELALTAVALLAAAWGGYGAYRIWRGAPKDNQNSTRFLAFSGVLLNVIFGATTLYTGIMLAFSKACSWV